MTQSMTVIRPAVLNDAPAIAHVQVEAWRTAYREIMPSSFLDGLSKDDRRDKWDTILTKDAPTEFNYVAELDGRIVGFASGGPERKSDPRFSGELYAIYLVDDCRGQGIGTGLFNKSVESLLQLEMESMKVWVLKNNPYRTFYERRGGELLAGEDPIKIGDKEMSHVAYGWADLTKTLD